MVHKKKGLALSFGFCLVVRTVALQGCRRQALGASRWASIARSVSSNPSLAFKKNVRFLRFWPIGSASWTYRGLIVVISWFFTARIRHKKYTIFKISSFRLDPYLTHYNIIFDNYLLIFFKLWSKISNDGKN